MKGCSDIRKMHNKTYDQRIEVVEEAIEASLTRIQWVTKTICY